MNGIIKNLFYLLSYFLCLFKLTNAEFLKGNKIAISDFIPFFYAVKTNNY
ncbi:hypothetical protein BPSP16_06255 [Brachyspira pilosicoli SP16]|nr:hypothetical protein BPSP16_06255 [Brachyspira pilosicoli SP16]